MTSLTRWLLALLLALALVPGARAAAVDDDVDGVDDTIDECIDTPPGDFVDAVGCSVCDCDFDANGDDWASRGAYQRCVIKEAKARKADGRITKRAFREAIKRARNASCGNPDLTRCCVWTTEETAEARCKVVDWERCDPDSLGVFDAEDVDVGSCLPNPCNEE